MIDLVDGTADRHGAAARRSAMVARRSAPERPGNGPTSRGELLVRAARDPRRTRASTCATAPAYERARDARAVARAALDLEALHPGARRDGCRCSSTPTASDIEAALRLAKEFGFRLIDRGRRRGVEGRGPAGGGERARAHRRDEQHPRQLLDARPAAGERRAARVARACRSRSSATRAAATRRRFNVRNVRFEAGNAVAYGDDVGRGAPRGDARRRPRCSASADRVGSLAAGQDANVVVWSGDPFEFATRGRARVRPRPQSVTAPSRQDLLMDRYKTLPPSYRQP